MLRLLRKLSKRNRSKYYNHFYKLLIICSLKVLSFGEDLGGAGSLSPNQSNIAAFGKRFAIATNTSDDVDIYATIHITTSHRSAVPAWLR